MTKTTLICISKTFQVVKFVFGEQIIKIIYLIMRLLNNFFLYKKIIGKKSNYLIKKTILENVHKNVKTYNHLINSLICAFSLSSVSFFILNLFSQWMRFSQNVKKNLI